MKRIINVLLMTVLTISLLISCSNRNNDNESVVNSETPALQKIDSLAMNKDTLDQRIIAEIEREISRSKSEMTTEALSVIGETQAVLEDIIKGRDKEATAKGKELIGTLEVLLAKDPSLTMIPVNVDYQKKELITDDQTVKTLAKQAREAMKKGYYQLASRILNNLKSEIVIKTYYLPTATYPDAIKYALLMLDENKPDTAVAILQGVLSTIVIQEEIRPLPLLYAEQMIVEAAKIDAESHENADKVMNLLENARYQLGLAEDMGYGRKDKDYKMLYGLIDDLERSVKGKENSESKFSNLKNEMKKFNQRLFSGAKNNK